MIVALAQPSDIGREKINSSLTDTSSIRTDWSSFNDHANPLCDKGNLSDSFGKANNNDENLEGIQSAEAGDWDTFLARAKMNTEIAQHRDQHGMLPIHWACTDANISLFVVKEIVAMYPQGLLVHNNAQYYPIHIAVRAGVSAQVLCFLYEAQPRTLHSKTMSGKTLGMLANNSKEASHLVDVLEKASISILQSSPVSVTRPSAKNANGLAQHKEKALVESSVIEQQVDEVMCCVDRSTASSSEQVPQVTPKPTVCQSCYRKFSLFRRRYQCIRCSALVCRKHIAGKLDVSMLDLRSGVFCKDCFRSWDDMKPISSMQNFRNILHAPAKQIGRKSMSRLSVQSSCRASDAYGRSSSVSGKKDREVENAQIPIADQKICVLEEQNMILNACIRTHETQYQTAMQLLNETMKRVSELEVHLSRVTITQ